MDIIYFPSKEPFFTTRINKGNKFIAKYNCFIHLVNKDDAANLVLYIPRAPGGKPYDVNSEILKQEYCFIPKGSTIYSNLRDIPIKAFEALRVLYSTETGDNKDPNMI